MIYNSPELWQDFLPKLKPDGNKYDRGFVLVFGGEVKKAGAAKLAAISALRSGAGLVSIICDKESLPIYAGNSLSLMTDTLDKLPEILADKRKNTVVIGMGLGVGEQAKSLVLEGLAATKQMVIDADALTSFADKPEELFGNIKSPCILTPHSGEFAKLFPMINHHSLRTQQALQAAKISGAVIVLKGHETVIAAPDAKFVINNNAPAYLATAGAGDVLSGIIGGLLAAGMPAFQAACAGVYIHAEAAKSHGIGLIAEDLPQALPEVLTKLAQKT